MSPTITKTMDLTFKFRTHSYGKRQHYIHSLSEISSILKRIKIAHSLTKQAKFSRDFVLVLCSTASKVAVKKIRNRTIPAISSAAIDSYRDENGAFWFTFKKDREAVGWMKWEVTFSQTRTAIRAANKGSASDNEAESLQTESESASKPKREPTVGFVIPWWPVCAIGFSFSRENSFARVCWWV